MTVDEQIAALKQQIAVLTATVDNHRESLDRISQEVHVHEQQLSPVRGDPLVNQKQAEQRYGPTAMRQHLAAGGEAPLPLAGLVGATGEAQSARIPETTALPQMGDASVKIGTVLHLGGVNYRRGKTAWEKL